MVQLGILLLILGVGTFVLEQFNYEFTILSWADDYQPWLSVGLAVLGIIILVAKALSGRSKEPTKAA